ncbi:threonine-phosphate decarboxylase CobD [Alkalihalobacterium chitinilyticum]|uniref:threonine-phosphate decarboxylase n=1 Tax=Alkalihalobacterium chitinilyticum TaxID=2980103 RepID=A0ABT5V955_9BACI|nr:threonine-phosphate decarboxylase CobD [Alkalihalobacterium chitinilyticum]MDE5411994.1 threonine-phosphate decarboxylase CobD [Alkalihalobacterium chitinilyticum]
MVLPNHGANPHYFVNALGLQLKEDSIDFSENVNPLGVPKAVLQKWGEYGQTIHTYPDPYASKLREKIALQNNVSIDQLLIGNGAAELILLIANHFRKKKILIVEPTFSEYRDACLAYECEVIRFQLFQYDNWHANVEGLFEAMTEVDAMFLCHPNNPTGTILDQTILLRLIQRANENDVTVIIDEAFYDFSDADISILPDIKDFQNVILLRSLTKMYAIPSLRLGYLISNSEIVNKLKKFQQPWSVNGIAQQVGLECISDEQHTIRTRSFIRSERKWLYHVLSQLGYEVSPSVVNFYLLKPKGSNDDLKPLIIYLIENGIVPRHTYNFLGLDGKYIRLAIKTRAENDMLLNVLERWAQQ